MVGGRISLMTFGGRAPPLPACGVTRGGSLSVFREGVRGREWGRLWEGLFRRLDGHAPVRRVSLGLVLRLRESVEGGEAGAILTGTLSSLVMLSRGVRPLGVSLHPSLVGQLLSSGEEVETKVERRRTGGTAGGSAAEGWRTAEAASWPVEAAASLLPPPT